MIRSLLNIFKNLYYKLYSFIVHNSSKIIISYLPFFENKSGDTDYYFVHIRIGWMEWIVYKYQYDIILDKYILAYITFLYIQFLIVLPFYYLYASKNKFKIDPEELDKVIFFRYFNNIVDIFSIIDILILISFYWVWPISALSHSLFYKVLTKSVFAWAIILFLFYYQFNLTIIAIFFVRYSWRQVVVVITQFLLVNIFIYLIWELYHEYYSMKLVVFLAFQCIHAYSLNGWNYWYTEFDFEDIWRLGPEFEGYVYYHEYYEAQELRKAKINKIYEYENTKYLERKKKRQEEAEKRKEEKKKLREEGKLSYFIIIKDFFIDIIIRIYRYFAYYDIELAIKMEQQRKDNFISILRSQEFRNKLMEIYMMNVAPYYAITLGNKWPIVQEQIKLELYEITHSDVMATKFYETFKFHELLEKKLIRALKESYVMHLDYYVLDKKPMTFNEFLLSFEDKINLVKFRRRLVDNFEDIDEVFEEEFEKTYEQLLTINLNENTTLLRLNLRHIVLLTRFGDRYEKDKILWDRMYIVMYAEAFDLIAQHNISIGTKGSNMEALLQYRDYWKKLSTATYDELVQIYEEEKKKANENTSIVEEEEDGEIEIKHRSIFDKFVLELESEDHISLFKIKKVLNYDPIDIMEQDDYIEEYDEYFIDFWTKEEKEEQEEFERSLWTYTYQKWKQMEEEDDYFKYTNFQQFVWYYDIELHIIGAYLFYWVLSYDTIWQIIPIYGHSNILS